MSKRKSAVEVVNNRIQNYVSTNGKYVPDKLLKMLSDLDWAIENSKDVKVEKARTETFA